MKKITLTIFMFALANSVTAQSFWVKPKKVNEEWCFNDAVTGESFYCDSAISYQNYNPLVTLKEHQVQLEIDGKDGINVYSIYKGEKNSSEEFIWGISAQGKETQILTDYRLANLQAGKVMNFVDFNPGDIHINNFIDLEKSEGKMNFQLGGSAQRKDLPLEANVSSFAELIVLDKPLSPLGKNILESSLSLKYGIPLSPTFDYVLNAQDGVLWRAEEQEEFNNNIGGIASESSLYLNQKQSKTPLAKGFLAIGLDVIAKTNHDNNSEIQEGESLLWGDDGKSLSFYDTNEGIAQLDRTWLIENNGFDGSCSFEVMLAEAAVLEQLPEGHSLWLRIEQGDSTHLYPASETQHFHNVRFFDGSQNMKFFHAPEKWLNVKITPSTCEADKLASIDVKAVGFEPPYQLVLESRITNELLYKEEVEESETYIDELQAGRYTLKVISENGLAFEQEINIVDESIPELTIPTRYIIDSEHTAIIDASAGMPGGWQYEWVNPIGESFFSSIMEFTVSGVYWLRVHDGNCESYTRIDVQLINENIKDVLIYPNPSPSGLFHFEVELENELSTDVRITDVSGRTLFQRTYDPALFIEDYVQLHANGMYFITFVSGSSTLTKKLVVQFP